MRVKDIALDGVVRQNPTFRLVLGTCPTLALTTAAFNGIGMGLSVTFVLICSNVLVSLLRKIIPDKVRIPAFVLIIATFVTVVQMVLKKIYAGFVRFAGSISAADCRQLHYSRPRGVLCESQQGGLFGA